MEAQAANLLSVLKRPAAPSEAKLDALNQLKSSVKHSRCPEAAIPSIVEGLKLAISQQTSSSLALSACSALAHLVKRLKIQDASGQTIEQVAARLLPALQERLGDLKEPVRNAASQALTELYPYLAQDVEHVVREEAIGGSNVRAKEAGMQWVVRMHRDESMPFKSYVSAMVARLEDSDGSVREAAKTALIELFSDAPERAKADLKRQLKAHGVRHSIETQILSHIGATSTSRPQTAHAHETEMDLGASTRSLPALDPVAHLAESINSEAAQPPSQETVPMDPLYVHSQRELEEIFRDMLPHFEGKEDEHNWTLRDRSTLKLRRLLKGNAPNEYHHAFMAGLKSVLDGVLKVANTLRTTMSTNGSQLVQELARTLGPALDAHVEILLQNFIKMSAQTKPIAAQNGRTTSEAIFQNCSHNVRMMQHIWAAAQEKNASARQCVPDWLKIVLRRQAGYKSHFESSGGLDLAEKTIRKGLDDAKPTVKEGMRGVYWTFAQTWPERAEKIMASLDEKSRTALQKDSNNPHALLHASQSSAAAAPTRSGGNSRMALREMLAEQRKAKAAGKVPDRPNSAMATISPAKPRTQTTTDSANRAQSRLRKENRVVSAASTVSETHTKVESPASRKPSSLMSGPVRRPRRPELARPQTADPYAARRMLRPETPASASPTNSPPKGASGSKTSIPSSSAARSRAKTAGTVASPNGSPSKRIDSGIPAVSEDDGFTMVMPHLQSSQQRARSPLAFRSPLKAMFEEARGKLERSVSPPRERLMGIDEAVEAAQQQSSSRKPAPSPQPDQIQIYEDPFTGDASDTAVDGERKVLGELQVNENVRVQSPTQSQGSSASPAGSPTHAAQPTQMPQDRAEVLRSRRLLASGIERIRTKTLDAHGFRRVQDLAKSNLDIWDGGKKYDELMAALLEFLQTLDEDPRLSQPQHKALGLKAQALGAVRALLLVHRKEAATWYAKALITLFAYRHSVETNSHIAADLDRTAEDIVKQAEPEACIDATMAFVSSGSPHARSVAMALATLRRLLESAKARSMDLGAERKVRLTAAAAKYLDNADADVRKADIELASDLFELFGSSKTEFWQEFKGTEEGRLGLLTYYIARK
ncbi:hypothetical protein BAUCODRAFT_54026, partial [Baudoinia panamericana UAMH 10762]